MTQDNPEEDLSSIAKILNALSKIANDPQNYSVPLNRQHLDIEENKGAGSGLLLFFTKKKSHDLLINQIKIQTGFNKGQINQLFKSKILTVDPNGRPTLNISEKYLYSQNKAIAYLLTLSSVFGFIVGQILYQPQMNLQSWGMYFCVGFALGNLMGFVLQRSFKTYPLISQLEKLKPWLATS